MHHRLAAMQVIIHTADAVRSRSSARSHAAEAPPTAARIVEITKLLEAKEKEEKKSRRERKRARRQVRRQTAKGEGNAQTQEQQKETSEGSSTSKRKAEGEPQDLSALKEAAEAALGRLLSIKTLLETGQKNVETAPTRLKLAAKRDRLASELEEAKR